MDWTQIISLILNLALGSGLIVSLATIKSQKRKGDAEADKAKAEVKTTELDNVQEAVKIWREMAEGLKMELDQSKKNYEDILLQLESLRKEVKTLNGINTKMVKLLDKITPDNLEQMVEQIKKIHEGN